jgi:hypothetical protein
VTLDSPIITKSSSDLGGEISIQFDKEIVIPDLFMNLTSDNDGPSYFNITLVVNEANLAAFAEDLAHQEQDRERRLRSSKMYDYKWKIIESKSKQELKFDFSFGTPEIISMFGPDKVYITLLKTDLVTNTGLKDAVDF